MAKAAASEPKKPAVMGRPKKEINKRTFEGAVKVGCTLEDVCSIFQVTDKPLNAWCKETYGQTFSEVFKKFAGEQKKSLRLNMMQMSRDKPAVAIFMAKNMLGWSDNPTPMADGSEAVDFKKAIARASRAAWGADQQAEDEQGDPSVAKTGEAHE
jgi:hypothetical protein